MPSFWLLNLALNCIHLLSWPLLALVYPLCASIQAIESDSHSDTLNLISYWILLSLIYLFEYTFLSLLQWFEYWGYMKLMIIAWLVIPDFGRASYVYNHFVRSCLSMNTQSVIRRLRNWKKLFVKNENFLVQAENYIKQNGTEALEELIASKIPAKYLNKEAIEVVPATEKNEMPQTNKVKVQVEQKGIKVLEMIETEKVIPEGKKDNTEVKENTNTSCAVIESEGNNTDSFQTCASKKVQKEWTCAICQVKTTSEQNLKSHFYGSKHKAACEALKAKCKEKQNKSKVVHNQGNTTKVQEMQNNVGMNKSRLRCEICNVKCLSEVDMVSHLKGKRHLAQIQEGTVVL